VYNFWKITDIKVYRQIIEADKQIEDEKRRFQEGEDELVSYNNIKELLMKKHLCMYGDVSMSAQKRINRRVRRELLSQYNFKLKDVVLKSRYPETSFHGFRDDPFQDSKIQLKDGRLIEPVFLDSRKDNEKNKKTTEDVEGEKEEKEKTKNMEGKGKEKGKEKKEKEQKIKNKKKQRKNRKQTIKNTKNNIPF